MAVNGYSRMQIRLHWAVVALVALQFVFNYGIGSAFREGLEAGSTSLTPLAGFHIVTGLAIAVLVVWRIVLRLTRGVPAPDPSHSEMQVKVARAMYGLFYALLILLPISGMIAWSQTSAAFGTVHEVLKTVMLLLIVLHVLAALAGQFVKKDGTMTKMVTPAD
ncbi:cytochrome b561 [Rhodovulum iodosum]|uniref:Cytochrome b561 n=1 Tax=Rhodovulum iodosum TaxID=68291 RepID=A0ABV3XXB9_9RHOB|nr:cytochrome b/b6 domain-containing protein [Rhodovulum robiginosum]RSK37836.1 cytochrome b [Rhodovulum robiginosum]